MKLKDGFKDIPSSKNDPEYSDYISSCFTKRAYENKGKAIEEAIRLGNVKNRRTQVYFCNYCGKYHVTTHSRETQSGSNHNIQVVGRKGKIMGKAMYELRKSNRKNNSNDFKTLGDVFCLKINN